MKRLCLGGKKEMGKLSELAGQSVEALLAKADIDVAEIPRDLNKLLKGLNIIATGMEFTPLERILSENVRKWGSILGAVAVKKDNVGIFYRLGSTVNRIRFTVAHELAHCCLHADKLEKGHVLMRYDGYFPDAEEFKANEFASELLIPERTIRQKYVGETPPSILELAKNYEVSNHVMEIRLMRLGLLGA